jgi:hypothetical protein
MKSRRLRYTFLSKYTKVDAGYNLLIYYCIAYLLYTMCVPSMGIWYQRCQIIPEGASPLQASW